MVTGIYKSEISLHGQQRETCKGQVAMEKIKPFHGNCASIVMQHKAKTILFRAEVSIAWPSTPSPWVSGALLGW